MVSNTSALGFGDDANVLEYGKNTEENCGTVEAVHEKCERWARVAGMGAVLAPTKYELVHMSGGLDNLNIAATKNRHKGSKSSKKKTTCHAK